jgi:Flp pilus assembly protein CpaB
VSLKKNVVPLVIIALVVAIAATGIFYGLIVSRMDAKSSAPALRPVAVSAMEKGKTIEASDFRMAEVKSAEAGPINAEDLVGRTLVDRVESGAVLTDRVLGKLRRRNLKDGIPTGMRAVTMHVSDSSSVMELVEAGDRVDVQSVSSRPSYGGPTDFAAKTILENVTVYALGATLGGPGGPRSVLTVLVSPQEAERLAQADAGSRLRIALRNRQDQAITSAKLPAASPIPQPLVTSNFRAKAPASESASTAMSSTAMSSTAISRDFDVHLVEVESSELASPDADWTKKLNEWKANRKGSLWASSKLDALRGGEVTWRGNNPEAAVRVRLESLNNAADGSIDLHILGEAQKRSDKRVHLSPSESALVAGLVPRDQFAAWREKFFPGRTAQSANTELIVVVTPAARR